jgi:hypothetical protein
VNKARHELLASVRRRRRLSERIAAVVLIALPVCAVTQAAMPVIWGVAILGGLAGHLAFSTGAILERVRRLRWGAPPEDPDFDRAKPLA